MIVRKVDIKKQSTSCNFCQRGELSTTGNSLVYPYEKVYEFSREGSGLCAAICDKCLKELIEKTKTVIEEK